MSDSLRPRQLVCPECGNMVKLDVARVESITYTCEKCEARIEQSLITGEASVSKKQRGPATPQTVDPK